MLRTLFTNDDDADGAAMYRCDPILMDTKSRYEQWVVEELGRQLMCIRGRDHEDGAIVYRMHRTSVDCPQEPYLLAQMYVAERAIAMTELASKGRNEKLMVVMDSKHYDSTHSPTTATIRYASTLMQAHYPERLKKLVIMSPPIWLRLLFIVLSPFLAKKTKEKICMACTDKQKETLFEATVDVKQATSSIRPLTGELSAADDADPNRFLYQVPFTSSYDE